MKKYNDEGYLNIMRAVIRNCLRPKPSKKEVIKRLQFINDKLFKTWCIATDRNLNDMREIIIKYNKSYIEQYGIGK